MSNHHRAGQVLNSLSYTADAVPKHTLGDTIDVITDAGLKRYVYVTNSSGGALNQGDLVHQKTGSSFGVVTKSTAVLPTAACYGVVFNTGGIPSTYSGWVQCSGAAEINTAAVITAFGDPVVPSGTAGRATNVASTVEHCVVGFYTEAGSHTAGDLVACILRCYI